MRRRQYQHGERSAKGKHFQFNLSGEMREGARGEPSIFDMMAERYDAWYDSEEGRPLYENELACLKPLVEDAPRPILEVGVGTGRFAMHFLPVAGVDPAVAALKIAEARGIETIWSVGEDLPFADGSFGCILIIVTLCFVEDPLKVLIEAKRVLRKDGRIVIGLVPEGSQWGTFYWAKKKQGHPFFRGARFYSVADIEKLVTDAGLKISRIRSTLMQMPDRPPRIEEPVEGYLASAGFLCIAAEKSR